MLAKDVLQFAAAQRKPKTQARGSGKDMSAATGDTGDAQPATENAARQSTNSTTESPPVATSSQKAKQRWIYKTQDLNRGQGIEVFENFSEMVKGLKKKGASSNNTNGPVRKPASSSSMNVKGVCQHYLERPLLFEKRKFDVRVFFLVGCVDPFVSFYALPSKGFAYCKRSCMVYDKCGESSETGGVGSIDANKKNVEADKNIASHITNQRAQRECLGAENFEKVKDDLIWNFRDLMKKLQEEKSKSAANAVPSTINSLDDLFEHVDKQILAVLQVLSEVIKRQVCTVATNKKSTPYGSFQLFGCDFILDEDFRVVLLECNRNPALHYGGKNPKALEAVIPKVVEEAIHLVEKLHSGTSEDVGRVCREKNDVFEIVYNCADEIQKSLKSEEERSDAVAAKKLDPAASIESPTPASSSETTQISKKKGVVLEFDFSAGASDSKKSNTASLQDRFKKYRDMKVKEAKLNCKSGNGVEKSSTEAAAPTALPAAVVPSPDVLASRRELFNTTLLKYLGQLYDDCDCCGLLRNVTRDLSVDLDWHLGDWNQSYQFAMCSGKDLIGVLDYSGSESSIEQLVDSKQNRKEEIISKLKRGDLIFYEGSYKEADLITGKKKPQHFDIVHIEVYWGPSEQTFGSRNRETNCAILESFDFPSKLWDLKKVWFFSLDGWLAGVKPEFDGSLVSKEDCLKFFPALKPGRKSVFYEE